MRLSLTPVFLAAVLFATGCGGEHKEKSTVLAKRIDGPDKGAISYEACGEIETDRVSKAEFDLLKVGDEIWVNCDRSCFIFCVTLPSYLGLRQ